MNKSDKINSIIKFVRQNVERYYFYKLFLKMQDLKG